MLPLNWARFKHVYRQVAVLLFVIFLARAPYSSGSKSDMMLRSCRPRRRLLASSNGKL